MPFQQVDVRLDPGELLHRVDIVDVGVEGTAVLLVEKVQIFSTGRPLVEIAMGGIGWVFRRQTVFDEQGNERLQVEGRSFQRLQVLLLFLLERGDVLRKVGSGQLEHLADDVEFTAVLIADLA